MANLRFWIPAVVLATVTALVPAQDKGAGAPAPAPAAVRIAVVDLDKAIEQYRTAVVERERLNKLWEQFNEQVGALSKTIDELKGRLSLLKPGSLDFLQVELDYGTAYQRRDGLSKLLKGQYDRELEKWELGVYEDLDYAIAQVAKDRGYAIVVRKQLTFEFDPETKLDPAFVQSKRLGQFTRRTVWFSSDEVDMTPFLIKYLQVFDPRAERLKAAEASAPKSAGAAGAAGNTTGKPASGNEGK